MKKFEIWIEGYAATGDRATAHCYGHSNGETFEEACIKLLGREGLNVLDEDKDQPDGYSRRYGGLSVWACTCFDNEEDARKSFG